jgi:hypothetical protein
MIDREPDIGTRRLIAVILGLLGVMVLLDVLVIAIVRPDAPHDGTVRPVLIIIVGGLLVVGGVISFAWPKRGSVETKGDTSNDDE